MRYSIRLLTVLGILLTLPSIGFAQAGAPKLFSSISKVRPDKSNPAQRDRHNIKVSAAAVTNINSGKKVSINLPERDIQFQTKSKRNETNGDLLISGSLVNARGEGSLLFRNGKLLSGSIREDDKNLVRTILPNGKGGYSLETYDARKFPGCQERTPEPSTASADIYETSSIAPSTVAADGTIVIDVMVVWSPEARAAAGSVDAIRATAVQAVAETNQAYANSQVFQRLNLVYSGELAQSEAADFGTNLTRLTSTNDGYWDEVHSIRNSTAADEVVLLVNNGALCGQAWLMTSLSTGFASNAFATVNRGCAVGYYSFAHELGHNMGSHHDHGNASGAMYSYGYGHRFFGTNGAEYRSIMAYAPGTRIQYFSNPDVLYAGTPTGVASGTLAANNALSLNNTASTVAAFRQNPTVCSTASPSLTLSPSSQSGAAGSAFNFTLTVKNNDTSACAPSVFSLGSAFPTDWTGSVSSSAIQLSPGSSGSVGIAIGSSSSSIPNSYNFSISLSDGSAAHSASSNGLVKILAPDTIAPSAPGAISTTLKRGQIALKWGAASDNVAVTGYLIYRNGVQIGTSTGTSYSDRTVTSKSSYQYNIKARDAAGNISLSSNTSTVVAR